MPKNAGDVPRSAQPALRDSAGGAAEERGDRSWNINELKKSAKRRAKTFSIIQRAYKGQMTAERCLFTSSGLYHRWGNLQVRKQGARETPWLPPPAGATECRPVFLFHLQPRQKEESERETSTSKDSLISEVHREEDWIRGSS